MSATDDLLRERWSEFLPWVKIDHIDFVERTDNHTNQPYQIVFIHFAEGAKIESTHPFAQKLAILEAGGDVKIVHDDPWFWIVRKNIGKKHLPAENNPFDPTAPISKEVQKSSSIQIIPPTNGYQQHDYSNLVPFTYFAEKVSEELYFYPSFPYYLEKVPVVCDEISKRLEEMWGVEYVIMPEGCMWKCKYQGFSFVVDLWEFNNDGEDRFAIEVRRLDCDSSTLQVLRKTLFEALH